MKGVFITRFCTISFFFNVAYDTCDNFVNFCFFYIEACSGRTYGDNCSSRCAKCRDMEECHHINGTCMNGCEIGYQGFKCSTGCYICIFSIDGSSFDSCLLKSIFIFKTNSSDLIEHNLKLPSCHHFALHEFFSVSIVFFSFETALLQSALMVCMETIVKCSVDIV